MALHWYTVVVDCHDIAAQARWWAETLDWELIYESDHEVVIVPRGAAAQPPPGLAEFMAQGQGLVFVPVEQHKQVKNRLHVDLAPHTSQDRDGEINRLVERGATRADIGQGPEATWTVLADPEGNEFCVLSSRDQ